MSVRILVVLLSVLASLSASAESDKYIVIAPGYGELDAGFGSQNDLAYKVGFGYQFHRQWYVEVGYQQLADDMPAVAELVADFQNGNDAFGTEADAFYMGLLGKASGTAGELFYRVGALHVDVQTARAVGSGAPCLAGSAAPVCETDESELAGVFGLGFDFWTSRNTMVRFEVEHVRGEDDIEMNGAYLGLRYNF